MEETELKLMPQLLAETGLEPGETDSWAPQQQQTRRKNLPKTQEPKEEEKEWMERVEMTPQKDWDEAQFQTRDTSIPASNLVGSTLSKHKSTEKQFKMSRITIMEVEKDSSKVRLEMKLSISRRESWLWPNTAKDWLSSFLPQIDKTMVMKPLIPGNKNPEKEYRYCIIHEMFHSRK